MAEFSSALRQVLFLLRGGHRLRGCDDEQVARGFHVLLIASLVWVAMNLCVVVPFFVIRKFAVTGLLLLLGVAGLAALGLLRHGRRRAGAVLFLSVAWVVTSAYSLAGGGIWSSGIGLNVALILGAAWLLGRTVALGFAGATILFSSVEAFLEHTGHALPVYLPGTTAAIWGLEIGTVGMAVCAMLAIVDVQRKHVALLGLSEKRFRSLSDASLEGIMIHDQGVILDANLAFARLFGYAHLDQLIGANGGSLLAPESRVHFSRQTDPQEAGPVEVLGVRKDGATFTAEIALRPLEYLGSAATLVTVRDITERKRSESALRESQERYRALFDRSLECVYLADFEGHFLDANQAALDLLGYRREDIASLTFQSLLTEDQLPLAMQTIEQVRARGRQDRIAELRLRHKDGGFVVVETKSSLIFSEGKPFALLGIARDLTERKRAEADLVRSHSLLSNLARLAPGALCQLQRYPDGRYVFAYSSPGVNEIFELTPESLREDAMPALDRVHPDDRGRVVDLIRESAGTSQPLYCEFRVILPLQGVRWRWCQAHSERMADGSTLWHGSFSDITGRKQRELALRDSEERYRRVSSIMSDIAFSCSDIDSGGYRIDWLAGATDRITGYSAEELKVWGCWGSVIVEEDRELFDRLVMGLEPGHTASCEIRVRHKDGSIRWISSSVRCVASPESGGTRRIYGGIVDITARKQAEEALRVEQERHSIIVQMAMDGFWLADREGRLLEVNEAYCRMSGYTALELQTMRISDLKAAEAPHDVAAHIEKIIAKGADRFESRQRRKDGSIFDVEISVRYRSGGAERLEVFLRDITPRKHAEAERERLQAELAQAQKMESVGRLAGGIAHDFNNLLTIINGYAGYLSKELTAQDPLREYAVEIRTAGDRAASLTRQLLAFSRKQVINPRPINLNSVVTEAERMLRRVIREDIRLSTKLSPYLGVVLADPDQIHHVIMNLVVNARDAMPEGGNLEIATADIELAGDAAAIHPDALPGRYVELTVTDTGVGMTEEIRRNIFEPFFTTKGIRSGTGLGLATVHGIVRQSGGWIQVKSEPGKGSAFRIYLPHVSGVVRTEAPPVATDALEGHETVLIVEDQEGVRRLAKAILKMHGYRVLEAANGAAANLVASRHPGEIDLLLTDVVMPGNSGYALSEQLRELRPGLRVILMSGYSEDLANSSALPPGAVYIQKPFDPEELAAKVREVLNRTP